MDSLPYRPNTGFKRPQSQKTNTQNTRELDPRRRSLLYRPKLGDEVTASAWCRMEAKIKELYLIEGYQLRLVRDILWCIYQFKVSYVLLARLPSGHILRSNVTRSRCLEKVCR